MESQDSVLRTGYRTIVFENTDGEPVILSYVGGRDGFG